MKDDIRYSEFLFLRELEKNPLAYFNPNDPKQREVVGLNQVMLIEMLIALLEDLYVQANQDELQRVVWRLRGEAPPINGKLTYTEALREVGYPRAELFNKFLGGQLFQFRITWRGLRRIDELRDLLKRDRILDDFGILLSIRYLRRDLEEALQRSSDMAVSVLYLDMDNFGKINKQFGQAAGDVVMKAYLESVRDSIGDFGVGYRGVGDETVGLIIGQGHDKVMEIAGSIKQRVAALRCEYKETPLPAVTVSVGVATTPPEARSLDVGTLAESRKRRAKDTGKNCIVDS
jgi:diguanylate cyclase (GGDEF)-like protein